VGEGVGDTLDVKDDGHTGDDPLLRRSLGLELGVEHIGCTSSLGLVDGALVHVLLLSAVGWDWQRAAVDDGHDRELLLRVALLELAKGGVPTGTFNLETEDVSTLFGRLLELRIPVELLGDLSLNI